METGILQRRNTPLANPSPRHRYYTDTPLVRGNNDNTPTTSQPSTPVRTPYYQNYNSPHIAMAGEQVSQWQSPKPAFPLNVQQATQEESTPILREHVDHFRPTRQLSVFEEESETESIPDTRPRSMSVSPHPLSPRSRRLANSRSSPNIFTSLSKSDASEEEEEEDDYDPSDDPDIFPVDGEGEARDVSFQRDPEYFEFCCLSIEETWNFLDSQARDISEKLKVCGCVCIGGGD